MCVKIAMTIFLMEQVCGEVCRTVSVSVSLVFRKFRLVVVDVPHLPGGDRGPQRLRQTRRTVERRFRQQHGELLATVARRRVLALDVGLQGAADGAQDPITEQMPVGVVDPLEVIDVRHQQTRPRAARSRGGEARLERAVEGPAVREPGERVDQRFLAHAAHFLFELGGLALARIQARLQRVRSPPAPTSRSTKCSRNCCARLPLKPAASGSVWTSVGFGPPPAALAGACLSAGGGGGVRRPGGR